MFNKLISQQPVADALKCVIDSHKPTTADLKRRNRRAFDKVQALERLDWQPNLFAALCDEVAAGRFTFNNRGMPTFAGGDDAVPMIIRLLTRYEFKVSPPDVMGIEDAADYVGMTLITFKRWVHGDRTPKPKSQLIGHTLVFSRSALDEFAAAAPHRAAGRPAERLGVNS